MNSWFYLDLYILFKPRRQGILFNDWEDHTVNMPMKLKIMPKCKVNWKQIWWSEGERFEVDFWDIEFMGKDKVHDINMGIGG